MQPSAEYSHGKELLVMLVLLSDQSGKQRIKDSRGREAERGVTTEGGVWMNSQGQFGQKDQSFPYTDLRLKPLIERLSGIKGNVWRMIHKTLTSERRDGPELGANHSGYHLTRIRGITYLHILSFIQTHTHVDVI